MAARNPAWTRDELILALDLYVRHQGNPPGKDSEEIVGLSRVLNGMGQSINGIRADYRNPNGVYMKAMNFRRLDPAFIEQGKVGLSRGNRLEEEVWNDFAGDPAKLARTAAAIRAAAAAPDLTGLTELAGGDDPEAEEGRILSVLHRRRERDRQLPAQKKARAIAETGKLECEGCGFNFEVTYGERGRGVIEVHHTVPLHALAPGAKTRLSDLALLCANCHRVVHAGRHWLTIEELRSLIKTGGAVADSGT
jgi:5-methylcytosine-specific restriction protein A